LYEGFLSTRPTILHDLGPILGYTDQTYKINYEVIRVQMPITEGASGSPLLDDDDEVVGVVSEIPVVALKDIQDIIAAYVGSGRGSGVLIGNFDTNRIVSELAYVVTGFETPGSGYAVPISDLVP
jgi:S1-C subfamily serine protease